MTPARHQGSVWWPAPSPALDHGGFRIQPGTARAGGGAGHHTEPHTYSIREAFPLQKGPGVRAAQDETASGCRCRHGSAGEIDPRHGSGDDVDRTIADAVVAGGNAHEPVEAAAVGDGG